MEKPLPSLYAAASDLLKCNYEMIAKENGYNAEDDWISSLKEFNLNPFKGRCYEMMMAIYELSSDKDDYMYVREKDYEGVYHWWMISKRRPYY